jgi:urease subunit gamma/beta
MLFTAAELARKRQARGIKLNYCEAVAIITSEILESARAGRSLAETVYIATSTLTPGDCMPGVPAMITRVDVEATFPDGTQTVTVLDPIRMLAWGSGQYSLATAELELNAGRPTVALPVQNAGPRPIEIGSHYHFYEANSTLLFDRERAYGMRPDIPSGSTLRFEPYETKLVQLVALGGERRVYGLRDQVNGDLA